MVLCRQKVQEWYKWTLDEGIRVELMSKRKRQMESEWENKAPERTTERFQGP